MAKPDSFPSVTSFSKLFGPALAQVMKSRGVTQVPVARAIDRPQSYVSERLRGLRAVDTDMIAGVAEVARVSPRTIVADVLRRMRDAERGDGKIGLGRVAD